MKTQVSQLPLDFQSPVIVLFWASLRGHQAGWNGVLLAVRHSLTLTAMTVYKGVLKRMD